MLSNIHAMDYPVGIEVWIKLGQLMLKSQRKANIEVANILKWGSANRSRPNFQIVLLEESQTLYVHSIWGSFGVAE